MKDATDMVDVPASVAGVEIAALFRETSRPGETKVSLRSKGGVPVNTIAVRHGGGGHPPAAGFTMRAGVDETAGTVLAEIEEALDRGA
jgi:phosphoesterase RecJ-like protein